MKLLLFVFLVALPAMADELILNDGRKIEWKQITDNGETYEVKTKKGETLTFKKADVHRLSSGARETPLTGASFTFEGKTKTVDLFSVIDSKRDALQGKWKFSGSALVVDSDIATPTPLKINVLAPDEYDLTAVVERKEGVDNFYIGLVVDGKQIMVDLDVASAGLSGLSLIDGRGQDSNGTGTTGQVFVKGAKPRTVVCKVRNEGIVITVDGKDLISWKADYGKASVLPIYSMPGNTPSFFVGTYKVTAVSRSSFVITKLTLTSKK
jgi:hypothetical protein